MNMNYTKEKWFFDENDHSVCVVKNGEELEVCNISSIDEGGIKRFHRGEESQANAMLITSAPALLEALQNVLKAGRGSSGRIILEQEDEAQIIAAIKQAKGEV
jgi:hypothetical protein